MFRLGKSGDTVAQRTLLDREQIKKKGVSEIGSRRNVRLERGEITNAERAGAHDDRPDAENKKENKRRGETEEVGGPTARGNLERRDQTSGGGTSRRKKTSYLKILGEAR